MNRDQRSRVALIDSACQINDAVRNWMGRFLIAVNIHLTIEQDCVR